MGRQGTLVICVQNLDFSGANQVIVNIVAGPVHQGNIVILSPRLGPIASRFINSGASVRVGDILSLLNDIRDVFCIICNTIMSAPTVNIMSKRSHPVIWVLHEWWTDEMVVENLALRNMEDMNLKTVKDALSNAAHVVCVCEAQRKLYSPKAPSSPIYVGVPAPTQDLVKCINPSITTFLVLGIVCPRKNQHWAVEQFKRFASDRTDVRLLVVGARHTRAYEIEYVEKVKAAIGDDPRIELYDVTDDVEKFYAQSDVLLFTSLNEVTPLVLSEAMSHRIPIISTNIAGIPEMVQHGSEGLLFSPGDAKSCIEYMEQLAADPILRQNMGDNGKYTFDTTFDLTIMVKRYQALIFQLAPPTILIDMDGVLVDWDRGFYRMWAGRSHVERSKSYYMEECVPKELHGKVMEMITTEGFFRNLPAMTGGVEALHEMVAAGFKVYICTAPLVQSPFCAQEKVAWVREHLGETWLPRLILTNDKPAVRGDLLIDDKPMEELNPGGSHKLATWKQIVFDTPYNQDDKNIRMSHWGEWEDVIWEALHGHAPPEQSLGLSRRDSRSNSTAALDALIEDLSLGMDGGSNKDAAKILSFKEILKREVQEYQDAVEHAGKKLSMSGDADSLRLFQPNKPNTGMLRKAPSGRLGQGDISAMDGMTQEITEVVVDL